MPIPLIPWEPCNIPEEIQAEFNRRKINRSLSFVKADKGGWNDVKGDWEKYRGPMTPWVRFCSNGAGRNNPYEGSDEYYDKQGFVFFGGKDFYSSYGFLNNKELGYGVSSPGIIGYMPDGRPHVIDNDIRTSNYPIHVPPPEIEKITVTIQKELYRRATVDWVCFSPKQLEYLTPYFLVPGISCILEWGWNHFDSTSLLDLNDITALKQFRKNPYPIYTKNILASRGNYDVLFGIITHFEWSIDGTKIRGKTEITSPDRIYAGLAVESSVIINSEGDTDTPNKNEGIQISKNLKDFVEKDLPNIKSVVMAPDPSTIEGGIGALVKYLKEQYPENDKWKEVLYGVFYGRDLTDKVIKDTTYQGSWAGPKDIRVKAKDKESHDNLKYKNAADDFDMTDQESVWITMELLCEILNLHAKELTTYSNQQAFRVDISDCVIGAHPNLISTNGGVLLIPNSEAPKYFYGSWGYSATETQNFTKTTVVVNRSAAEMARAPRKISPTTTETVYTDEYEVLKNSDKTANFQGFGKGVEVKRKAEKEKLLADYHLWKVCSQFNAKAYRDNLDELINKIRYEKTGKSKSFSFPFSSDVKGPDTQVKETYPARYTGKLKDLYINVAKLQEIVKNARTFTEVLETVFLAISSEAGDFWDLRLVNSTGRVGQDKNETVTQKVVDYRFIGSVNEGKVYTFDYFDADSLLQSIRFTPTTSNAQAIRTMYAETNNPQNRVILSDTNELLDYHFRDRLRLDVVKNLPPKDSVANTFKEKITSLQFLKPAEKSMQMTLRDGKGNVIVKRLVLPSRDILKLLLDDNDKENNPRYTGIMPGIQAQFTIQGIGGLRTFMYFLVRNLPEPYSHENIVFRIIDLTENIEAGKWTTTITAGILPLRNFIKRRLGLLTETGKTS